MTDFMHQVNLDRQDVRILDLLQRDSRISRVHLAEQVNLSASQCYRRLKRLEESGLIARYVTLLNLEKAGFDVCAMVMVSFSKTAANARNRLLQLINDLDEIQECYSASGEYDFVLRVNCTGMRAYSELINKKLLSDTVVAIHSYILMDCLKFSTAVPLQANS
ncbi:MAG: transcriptional regulatory protein [Osedax symbiont Rs2]|nr:MAG: transcriptional regulatory protein [Osedax symbiont Rs2]